MPQCERSVPSWGVESFALLSPELAVADDFASGLPFLGDLVAERLGDTS